MEKAYESCMLCPRLCGVNRNAGEVGFCGETAELRLAWAGLHFGEEPPVTGTGGSGTIFVTGCNLGCSFCQNYQISHESMGKVVTGDQFFDICCALRDAGAENINIVTGSHAIPALASYLTAARDRDFSLPILWNSSAYETVEALKLLSGIVDRWLPDLKTLNSAVSDRFFRAADYPETACNALLYMAELAEKSSFQPAMIVRHLVLPEQVADSRDVLAWFAANLRERALLSVMTQYTPVPQAGANSEQPPDRFLLENEYDSLPILLDRYGIEEGFIQELVEDSSWLPDFTRTQPFSSSLARPVWHWSSGFVQDTGNE